MRSVWLIWKEFFKYLYWIFSGLWSQVTCKFITFSRLIQKFVFKRETFPAERSQVSGITNSQRAVFSSGWSHPRQHPRPFICFEPFPHRERIHRTQTRTDRTHSKIYTSISQIVSLKHRNYKTLIDHYIEHYRWSPIDKSIGGWSYWFYRLLPQRDEEAKGRESFHNIHQ
jgi:hypothetical protein